MSMIGAVKCCQLTHSIGIYSPKIQTICPSAPSTDIRAFAIVGSLQKGPP